jgi:hypothetical protein
MRELKPDEIKEILVLAYAFGLRALAAAAPTPRSRSTEPSSMAAAGTLSR